MLPRNFNIKGRGRPTRRTVTKMMPKTPEQGEPSYYSSLFYKYFSGFSYFHLKSLGSFNR